VDVAAYAILLTPSFFKIHTRLQSSSKDVTPGVLGIDSWFSTSDCALYSILSANALAVTRAGLAFASSKRSLY